MLPFTQQAILWWALFVAFAVNIPMWPFHTWLIDTHVEAPTSGSMILSGLMVKVGCYGLLRLNFSLFPDASSYFAPVVYLLSCFSILYASLAALVQENIKRAIAYASFASIAFVTLGIFTFNSQGIVGAIIHMVSHGLVVAALFYCIGILHDRFHSYDISSYGGLVDKLPRYSTFLLIFMLALIGIPGLGGFIGELLVIIGIFRVSLLSTFALGLGIILITSCCLWIYRRLVFDKLNKAAIGMKVFVDLKPFEIGVLTAFTIPLFWIGLYPHRLFTIVNPHVVYLVEKYRKSGSFKYDISKDIADYFSRKKP
jgi:NADH-quinone oxidoreductase subunit M